MFRRIFSSVVTSLVAFGIVALSGPLQAQAAVNVSPWVRTSGTALADEFETIMAHGGMEPVTRASASAATSGTASALLGGAGAGLALGTNGLRLYSKITTGSWNTYTDGISCGNDWVGKAADFVGKSFKLMSFGLGGYSCATAPGKIHTQDLSTVDLDDTTVDKNPVPDPVVDQSSTTWLPIHLVFHGVTVTGVTYKDYSSTVRSSVLCFSGVPDVPAGYRIAWGPNGTSHDPIQSLDSFWPLESSGAAHGCATGTSASLSSNTMAAHSPSTSLAEVPLWIVLQVTPAGSGGQSSYVEAKNVVTGAVDFHSDTQLRQISCRVTATDGTHIDAPGDSYSDSSGIPLDSQKWGCNSAWQQTINAGKVPQRVTATSTFPGAVGDPQVLLNQPVTPDVQKEVTDSPECVSASSNSAGCVKRLYKKIGGQLRSCADADIWDSCADWLSESETSPDLYVCKYGSKTVELSECAMYAPTFKYPHADTDLHYQTDQDIDTAIDTSGAAQAEPDSQNCWAQMISWNPIDWVLTPVKCSLSWAFKPDSGYVTQTQMQLQTDMKSTFVQDISDAYTAALPTGDETQCLGPKVSVSAFGLSLIKDSYPLSVCQGSGLEMLPKIFRLALVALAGYGALLLIRRQVSSLIGLDDASSVSGKGKS